MEQWSFSALGGLYAALKNPKFVKVRVIRFAEGVAHLFQESNPQRITALSPFANTFPLTFKKNIRSPTGSLGRPWY
jgi:hypothetical protein